MRTTWRFAVAGAAAAACTIVAGGSAFAQLDAAVSEAERSTAAAAASQRRIDGLADQTGDLFREYRATLQRIDSQQLFVEQQRVFLRSQENEILDLERQITEVGDVLRDLLPMQFEMIEELGAFVAADIPFLRQDRLQRASRLRTYMDDPGISPAERYRQIVEAFQIEADYGRFLDTWSGPFLPNPLSDADPDLDARTVDYLLIGRVAFIYMTQDESEMGIWNEESKSWDQIPGSFRLDIRRAIRMAREVTTPNVFMAPVRGATTAQSPQG
jgi:hypothetical protein